VGDGLADNAGVDTATYDGGVEVSMDGGWVLWWKMKKRYRLLMWLLAGTALTMEATRRKVRGNFLAGPT
jgi:hypothetical protein